MINILTELYTNGERERKKNEKDRIKQRWSLIGMHLKIFRFSPQYV